MHFWEIFAGTGGWSKAVNRRGLRSGLLLDSLYGWDLLSSPDVDMAMRYLNKHRPHVLGLAYPCKLWSQAQRLNRRSPERLAELREPYRQLLRNTLAMVVSQTQAGRYIIVEGPDRSEMWKIPEWSAVQIAGNLRPLVLDQCRYGSKYRKRTKLWTNLPEATVLHLQLLCNHGPGAHPHLIGFDADGVPLTRHAAQYPALLCAALAEAVANAVEFERDHHPLDSAAPRNPLPARFDAKQFNHWRKRIGGLDLDAAAYPVGDNLLPDVMPSDGPPVGQAVRGRRAWVHVADADILPALQQVLAAQQTAGSAALCFVPERPDGLEHRQWREVVERFYTLKRFGVGAACLQQRAESGKFRRLRLSRPHLLLWLPPSRPQLCTVHVAGVKREQNKILTDRLSSGHRVDALLTDLRQQSWGKLGRPIASDVYALMAEYPGRLDPLIDDVDHSVLFGITANADAFGAAHCEHCPLCKRHGSVHTSCYGHVLCHALKHGWRFPMIYEPPVQQFDNYDSIDTPEAYHVVRNKMKALEEYGVFTVGSAELPPGFSTVPLQAVIRDKDRRSSAKTGKPVKVRVCMDLSRNLNDFCPDWPFRYADIHEVVSLLEPNCWMAVLDLEKWFLQLPTHRSRWKYQTFFDPRTHRYRAYRRTPFGFKLAPAFASAISSEICHILRSRGVNARVAFKCSCFVDDLIIIGATQAECEAALQLALSTLSELGFPVQDEKVVRPAQVVEYLGVELNSKTQELRISDERRLLLLDDVEALLKSGTMHRKQALQLLGKLNWFAVVMPGARPYMRRLWQFLSTLPPRGRRRISTACFDDLYWWWHRLQDGERAGSRFWPSDDAPPILTMKSDASGHLGCGYVIGEEIRTYVWKAEELYHSIAWKELFPIYLAAQEFGESWANKIVRAGIDNAGVVYMLNSGSAATSDCAELLRRIADLEYKHSFTLFGAWVPREFNEAADQTSRNNIKLVREAMREEADTWALNRPSLLPSAMAA